MKKSSEILSLVVFLFLISSQIFPTSLDTTIPLIIFNNYNCFLLSWQSVPVAWASCPHSGAAAHHSNFFSTRQAPKIFANDFLRAVSPPRQHTVLVPFDLASRFFSLPWLLFSGLSRLPWTHTDAKNCPHNTWNVSPVYQVSQNWIGHLANHAISKPHSPLGNTVKDGLKAETALMWAAHTSVHFVLLIFGPSS